jgi:membrane protease YdiL (CAAX protease family)
LLSTNVSDRLYVLAMNLSLGRAWALSIVGVYSIVLILFLRVFPNSIFSDVEYLSSILAFVMLGIFGLFLLLIFKVQVLEFFRMPVRTKASLVSIGIAAFLVIPPILLGEEEDRFLGLSALGLLFILSVGFGEEVFSRGFVYGYLARHGLYFGLIWSSVIFGMLHLNRYLGSNWDGWRAYSHVVSASAMGLFMCALMVVTKSIWSSIIFHALANWHLAFKDRRESDAEIVGQSLLENLLGPLGSVLLYTSFAFFILWVNSGMALSPRVTTLLTRFKLVDPEPGV